MTKKKVDRAEGAALLKAPAGWRRKLLRDAIRRRDNRVVLAMLDVEEWNKPRRAVSKSPRQNKMLTQRRAPCYGFQSAV